MSMKLQYVQNKEMLWWTEQFCVQKSEKELVLRTGQMKELGTISSKSKNIENTQLCPCH